jgi:tripartite-type tricarboxylate transporter receptor subunit TctC
MKQRVFVLGMPVLLLQTVIALAQPYPSKPLRVIVTQTPGSSMDVLTRMVTPKMSELLRQQFVIDNRGGAGGLIGAQIGARAVPDGYTLIFGGASSMINTTFTYKKVGFDPVKDFEPISLVVAQEAMLVVTPSSPAKSVKELIALAKAQPGKLNLASAGIGSSGHLAGVMFASMAGIDSVHVPYKGGAPMAFALIGGEAQWGIGLAASFMGHVKAGRLRALAISSKQRSPLIPELPTIDESGVPGYDFTSWDGFFAPKGTPRPYIMAIHAAIQKALADPDVKDLYTAQGMAPLGSASPEEFGKFFREDFDRVAKLIRIAGIKPE